MSQFMLIVGPLQNLDSIPGLQIFPVKEADDFLKSASQALIPNSELASCWYVQDEADGSTDTLFTEAQGETIAGTPFSATRLGKLLYLLLKTSREIILWYGNDWDNLPLIENEKDFIAQVESQLFQDSGEVYLRYRKRTVSKKI